MRAHCVHINRTRQKKIIFFPTFAFQFTQNTNLYKNVYRHIYR